MQSTTYVESAKGPASTELIRKTAVPSLSDWQTGEGASELSTYSTAKHLNRIITYNKNNER